jgi:hypothetical protein
MKYEQVFQEKFVPSMTIPFLALVYMDVANYFQ